jgi:signal transduction histidine kinase/FixJ family two-component response regulator
VSNPQGSPLPNNAHAVNILILDDDQDTCQRVASALTQRNFGVQVYQDGENVVERAKLCSPNLVLLDTRLPGTSGFEAFHLLKNDPQTSAIPIIFIADSNESEDGFDLGADGYQIRPVRPRQLLAFLEQLLLLREMAEQLQAKDETLLENSNHIEVTSQIGEQITSILDPGKLARAVVELLQERFDYYFVSLWQLNERQDILSPRAGLGRNGYQPFSSYFTLHTETVRSIVALVARSGKAHSSPDVENDPHYMFRAELPDARSELALPLHIGPRMVGVLDIQSDQFSAFDAEVAKIFQSLADQVAVAIRNAELYDLQNRRRSQAELLERIGRTLSSTLDIKDVQARILIEVAGVVPYALGFVYLRDGDRLRQVTHQGSSPDATHAEATIPLRYGSALWQIIESGEPLVVDDLTMAPGWLPSEIPSEDFSWLGVPLSASNHTIGILALTRTDPCAFGPNEVIFLSTFAAQAAIALENAGLYAEIRRFSQHLEELVEERARQLDEAYHTLQKLDSNKSDFINVTAHELRTPLTVIKGYVGILQNDPAIHNNDYLGSMVTSMLNGVNRLHEIVNSMLDVARINSQVLTPFCEWVELSVALQSIEEEFAEDLVQRNLTLTITEMEGLIRVYADPSLLYKVLYNVVVNAIKYTPDGGRIIISAHTLTDAQGDFFVEVLVRDTGIGIDAEHHQLIFEQFYQTGKLALHSSGRTKFKGGGPGLGLAIAKGIVLAHGGRIWVESERYDEQACPGSTFHILFPGNGPPMAESDVEL